MPRRPPTRMTLREIARRAGVSAMTVSRALSGRGASVRPDTARRIRKIAGDLGYAPSTPPRGERLPTLVLFAENVSSHHYLAELVDLTARAIEERHHGVIACQSMAALFAAVTQFHLSGAVVIAPPESFLFDADGFPAAALPVRTPLVLMHSAIEQHRHAEVSPDVEDMAFQAADHLLRLGHRQLAYLGGPMPELEPHWFTLRRRGILRALAAYQQPPTALSQVACGDAELAAAALQHVLRRAPRTTGLICINDEVALAACVAAGRLGRRVPTDLSIVGSNDVRLARYFTPSLTTIAVDLRALVETALHVLFDLIQGRGGEPADGSPRVLLPARLVVRESTAPPTEPASPATWADGI